MATTRIPSLFIPVRMCLTPPDRDHITNAKESPGDTRRAVTMPDNPVTLPVVGEDARFPVRRIYCVGRNYLDHIREMKEADERDPPFFFQKPTDAIVHDGAVVPYPPGTQDFQFEVELVVAIGRGGSKISVQSAETHIFGYAIGIDLTRRDLQRDAAKRGLPWEMGKSFDHSLHAVPFTGSRQRARSTKDRSAYPSTELSGRMEISAR